jgi:hypothetical protein
MGGDMFHIALTIVTRENALKNTYRPYDEQFDDVTAIIEDICDVLQDSGAAVFSVGGFGQDNWPVDVRHDLPHFLDQAEDVIAAIRKGNQTDLAFPEQGIQRIVQIATVNGSSTLTCTSFGNWKPNGEVVTIQTAELLAQLAAIVRNFVTAAGQYCPELSRHPWSEQWRSRLLRAIG